MLNSRDISLLRPDVAANCQKLIHLSQAAGYRVLVTGTVRDDDFQQYVFEQGTGGKPPATFHSVKAGLAFDICQNIKGREYNDDGFWRGVSAIGKKMGFTWGGDWKSFIDKPHFQWDAGGKFRGRDIVAGRFPPPMPAYLEEDDMTESDVRKLIAQALEAKETKVYQDVNELPDWAMPTVEKLIKQGALLGDDKGLQLSYDQLRVLVINDRAGLYQL